MSRGFWTAQRRRIVEREWPTCSDTRALAARLGCTLVALRTAAQRFGVVRRLPWTGPQTETLRTLYGKVRPALLEAKVGRPIGQCYQMAARLGLMQPRQLVSDADRATIRRMHAEGCRDPQIALALHWKRECVGANRRKMGLPSNAFNEKHKDVIRANTRRQLERAGLRTIGEVRAEAYRDYARECGWPADLRPRAVQMLNLLAESGVPLTRRQLVEGVGMPWKRRNSGASNDPEGSYLAHLAARGLVVRLIKQFSVRGRGKGQNVDLYCLSSLAWSVIAARAAQQQETSCPSSVSIDPTATTP